jgi:hypothetical protein
VSEKHAVETPEAALEIAKRIARSTGLVPGEVKRARRHVDSAVVHHYPMKGSLNGVAVSFQLQFTESAPFSELGAAVDVRIGLDWLDVEMVGRTTPEVRWRAERPLSDELLSEFHVRCDDETYLGELIDRELERALLAVNLSGYRPRLNHRQVQMSAGALDGPGAEKLLREATQLAALIEVRRSAIDDPREERAIVAALSSAEKAWHARLDRDRLRFELESVLGKLTLQIEHPSYGKWRTDIQLALETALPCEVSIAPVRRFYETWFRPDIQTGDARFDRRFTIRGQPEERVRAILGEASRRALERVVELTGDVLVTQSSITSALPFALAEAARASAIVEAMQALGDALTSHVGGQRAYR